MRLPYGTVNNHFGEKQYTMDLFSLNASSLLATKNLPTLTALNAELTSSTFIDNLKKRFQVNLNGNTELNVWQYKTNDFLSPHLDKVEKKITLLIYLNHIWNAKNGGNFIAYHNEAFTDFSSVSPHPNRGVFLRRTKNSWHAVEPVNSPNETRRSLQIIYY